MAWHGKHLGELVAMLHQEFGEYHYGRVDLHTKDGQKEKELRYFADPNLKTILDWPVTRSENIDGIKVYIGELGWVMVRASGTENMLRVYSETTRPDITRRALDAVVSIVPGGGAARTAAKERSMEVVNFKEKLNHVNEYWSPKIVGEINDSYVKVVKFQGEFVWPHPDMKTKFFLLL